MEVIIKKYDELSVDELYEILKARAEIFVVEQNCAYQDLDSLDQQAYHVWLEDEGRLCAYLRVLPAGTKFKDEVSLGRIISIKRRCGLGARVVAEGIRTAKEKFGAKRLLISAQCQARAFYEAQGFVKVSDEYLEDNIPHIEMLFEI